MKFVMGQAEELEVNTENRSLLAFKTLLRECENLRYSLSGAFSEDSDEAKANPELYKEQKRRLLHERLLNEYRVLLEETLALKAENNSLRTAYSTRNSLLDLTTGSVLSEEEKMNLLFQELGYISSRQETCKVEFIVDSAGSLGVLYVEKGDIVWAEYYYDGQNLRSEKAVTLLFDCSLREGRSHQYNIVKGESSSNQRINPPIALMGVLLGSASKMDESTRRMSRLPDY
jgi:hypothetical protein